MTSKLARFRSELLELLQQGQDRDDVYRPEISFFPITQTLPSKEDDDGSPCDHCQIISKGPEGAERFYQELFGPQCQTGLLYRLFMVLVPTKIAVVFDCDDTLAPDTTNWLLDSFGIETSEFWNRSGELLEKGWDNPHAYLHLMREESRKGGKLQGLTRDALHDKGKEVPFFPGVPDVFEDVSSSVTSQSVYRNAGIQIEYYVISGGIEELIRHTRIKPYIRDIWGCNLAWGDDGRMQAIKNVVTFTEKTRYLYQINKGFVGSAYRTNPYMVNAPVEEPRPVPFKNMIYLGDGPSDIPCMSVVQRFGGQVIGILSEKKPENSWALGFGRRANVTVPAEFQEGSHGSNQLKVAVKKIAQRILFEQGQGGIEAPGY